MWQCKWRNLAAKLESGASFKLKSLGPLFLWQCLINWIWLMYLDTFCDLNVINFLFDVKTILWCHHILSLISKTGGPLFWNAGRCSKLNIWILKPASIDVVSSEHHHVILLIPSSQNHHQIIKSSLTIIIIIIIIIVSYLDIWISKTLLMSSFDIFESAWSINLLLNTEGYCWLYDADDSAEINENYTMMMMTFLRCN